MPKSQLGQRFPPRLPLTLSLCSLSLHSLSRLPHLLCHGSLDWKRFSPKSRFGEKSPNLSRASRVDTDETQLAPPRRRLRRGSVEYDVIGKIGEDTYGLVFLAKIKSNRSKSIAIKKFKQSKDGDSVSPTTIREIMLLREISHENVVKLANVHINHADMSLYLAFDYAEHDLYVMGDGKEHGVVKIADFGLARIYQAPLKSLSENGVVVTNLPLKTQVATGAAAIKDKLHAFNQVSNQSSDIFSGKKL